MQGKVKWISGQKRTFDLLSDTPEDNLTHQKMISCVGVNFIEFLGSCAAGTTAGEHFEGTTGMRPSSSGLFSLNS